MTRSMRQPRKDTLRRQLAVAEAEVAWLKGARDQYGKFMYFGGVVVGAGLCLLVQWIAPISLGWFR